MSKELFISASPHETKVAVLEDDELVEVYHERDTNTGLVGGIYKGRVSRVLPGMQSAFVDIGLERDAFLYVSDFFEDADEYDKIVAEAEARVTRFAEGSTAGTPAAVLPPVEASVAEAPPAAPAEEAAAPVPAAQPETEAAEVPATQEAIPQVAPAADGQPTPAPSGNFSRNNRPGGPPSDFRRGEHRGRRRRRHGQSFGERKFGPKPEFRSRPVEPSAPPAPSTRSSFEVLPGESLAKYRNATNQVQTQEFPTSSVDEPGETDFVETMQSEPVSAAPEVTAAEVSSETAPVLEAPSAAAAEPEVAEARGTVEPPAPEIVAAPVIAESPAPEPPVEAVPSVEAPVVPVATIEPPQEIHSEPAIESAPQVAVVDSSEPARDAKPRPLWNRLVSSVMRKPQGSEEAQAPVAQDVAPEVEPAIDAAADNADSAAAGRAENAVEEVPVEAESTPEEEISDSAAEEPETDGASEASETNDQNPEAGTPGDQPARAYTLREPNQKPRFAPRRRGRHGRGKGDFAPGGGRAPRREQPRSGNHQSMQIAELLKEGQEILVQIAKEPLGRKGARITSHIALPGRYLVYMPTVDHIGVSRKIASEEERLRLKNIMLDNKGPVTGGFIVRTAGAGRPEEELKADMKFLSTLWADIRAKAERTKAPSLLHRDLDLMQRILRDILSPDFKTVRVDSEIEYERALDFVSRCQPSLVGHVKLYTRDTPMFEEFGIQTEIDKALKSKVWLKSGGYIVINQTEALVAIDVNTGKYVGKTNRLEDTIVKTNIDAVKEIVRQIRLRDLGGIVVIDFIDMDERRNRNKVVQALEEALRYDRAPTKILSFNDFGLVALTRKRVKQSLERTLCEPCSYCSGSGWIKSVTTLCYEILAEARKMAAEHDGESLTLRVHPEVAKALKSREGVVLSELEAITKKDVIVKSDPSVHQERFEIY
jgi:Rne/Rng family ribonuclease